jgi:hypothetical protein
MFWKSDVLKQDILKFDVLKLDVLEPDVLKPDVLRVYVLASGGGRSRHVDELFFSARILYFRL